MPNRGDDMTKFERKRRLRSVRTRRIKMIASAFISEAEKMSDKQLKKLSRQMSTLSIKHFGSA